MKREQSSQFSPANLSAVRRYLELMETRRKGASGLIPPDHRIDWNNAPPKFKRYGECARVPLSGSLHCAPLTIGMRPLVASAAGGGHTSFSQLSDFLLLSSALLRRRLTVNWSSNVERCVRYKNVVYARSAPSGGGLHPIELYLVSCAGGTLAPGVYHYDVVHHALSRVRMGNFDAFIGFAVGHPAAQTADLLFILTMRFWRNVFKYHNLGYQLAMQDAGTFLGAMEQVGYSLGWNMTILYWFHDRLLCSLLGLEMDQEAPFALVAVNCRAIAGQLGQSFSSQWVLKHSPLALARVDNEVEHRSQKRSLPELILRTHEETLLEEIRHPKVPSSFRARTLKTAQPPGFPITGDLFAILCDRETSMGRFRRAPAIEKGALDSILEFSTRGCSYVADVYEDHAWLPSLDVTAILRNVQHMQDGVYDYDFSNARLSPHKTARMPTSLQSIYFLKNYNVDQVSALLVVSARFETVFAAFGGRGLRVVNAEAGILTQRMYLASTALSVGCGVILGFDSQQIRDITAMGPGSTPVLVIFLGHQVAKAFAYDFRIY
jgi:SagB-type dehydrogenase family enzyme